MMLQIFEWDGFLQLKEYLKFVVETVIICRLELFHLACAYICLSYFFVQMACLLGLVFHTFTLFSTYKLSVFAYIEHMCCN
jgi:hypothetical protein